MKKGLLFCLLVLTLGFAGCLLEEAKEEAGTGTLKVTVRTTNDIWLYPNSTNAYNGSPDALFGYPYVGGNANISSLPGNGSDPNYYYPDTIVNSGVKTDSTANAFTSVGTLENYVYIFSALEQKSSDNAVLYNGSSNTNNDIITIENITPGTYYIVAFYDYRTGGEETNIFNRYDRYAIYTDSSNAETGTTNSTPYFDRAASITIGENETVEITLDIYNKNWVLGKPKATDKTVVPNVEYEMGRYFLRTNDYAPVP